MATTLSIFWWHWQQELSVSDLTYATSVALPIQLPSSKYTTFG
jgi:hypothetical protein